MSARGKSSKKGFTNKIKTDAVSVDDLINLDQVIDYTVVDPFGTLPAPVTVVPPTTPTPNINTLSPPINISAGPLQTFTQVSVSANGVSATYTCSVNHGYAVGDIVIISGFSTNGLNGTYTITAITGKTFTVASSVTATGTGGSVYNNNNSLGTVFYTADGTPYVDVLVSFEQVISAAEYRIEVTKIG